MGKCYDIPEITIHVEGGLVQDVDIPKGTNAKVIIKDYDISDFANENEINSMREDKYGKYDESIYEN